MLLKSQICDFGWQAPNFDLATPDGQRFTRDQAMGPKGLLVAFICNHCPYVIALIDRLAADMQALQADGVGCVAKVHGLSAPYLVDEDQSVGQAYGAVCTPDFFGFDATGGLQYRGRLDDVGMRDDPATRVPELLNAMRQVAQTGQGPKTQTPSMGCSIKWR